MALRVSSASALSLSSLPVLSLRSATLSSVSTAQTWWRQSRIAFGIARAAALPSIQLRLPDLLSDIWESILRAVPKKKTSHRKKRQRFLAGKSLRDIVSLNKCPGCGTVKRAHTLCPYCVQEIRDMWAGKDVTGKRPAEVAKETKLEKA